MDLCRTTEQLDIRKAAREFAVRAFDPDTALQLDQNNLFPFALWKTACDLGLKGIGIPEEYGGQGCGLIEKLIVLCELSSIDSSLGVAIGLADIGSGIILRLGNEEQRRLLLPLAARGEAILSLVAETPVTGRSSQLDLRKEGGCFVVSGKKEHVLNGAVASHLLLVMRAGQAVSDGRHVFCLEKDRQGLCSVNLKEPLGLRTSSPADLVFNDVKLDQSDLLQGGEHTAELITEVLNERKMETSAQLLGMMQNAFSKALDYAKQREQFQSKIIKFQAIQLILAGMATRIEAARGFFYRVLDLMERGKNIDPRRMGAMITMLRSFCADASSDVILDAIRIFGGYGLITDLHLERMYRDALTLSGLEGNSIEERASVAIDLASGVAPMAIL